MKISEIDRIFKEVFKKEKGLVKTVESVYEKSDNDNFYKLVISIHSLTVEDTIIIHTKFIFKTNLEKTDITENSFIYLYDINCIYHSVNFNDYFDLEKKLKNIIESNKFGKDIQTLSEFIDTPELLLNHYFEKNNITKYNVDLVNYKPKFKIKPCNETTFDFIININNNYDINLCISKVKDKVKDKIQYDFRFKFMDINKLIEVDSLLNMHFLIGSELVEILDEKL